ncbi:MAG TPA: hopanoid biosynthesis-associated protein HpnK [Candidatus Baltobacteraceae bacterium]|nr:hopanoid biosynthesis-associated protein HpnK [Candidatus Baltobacteraceae bacterium]
MATPKRRLIVNADDFGLSHSVNEAVIRAHRDGILTSASLMVNEPGFDEAVKLAKENPKLGVGLHLTLLHGHSALPPEKIPGLVNSRGEFSNSPVGGGMKYFFFRSLREQLRAEIHAQFEKFKSTGLPLDHVNGHLHFHLHPTIFKILMEDSEKLGITHLRFTRDCLSRARKISKGHLFYKISHATIFEFLSARTRKTLAAKKIRHAQITFGLLQNARVDEDYVLKLLPLLPDGDSELYSHPSLDKFKHEFDALVSPRVKELVQKLGIELIRYQDL